MIALDTHRGARRPGFSIMESTLVFALMTIAIAMSVPTFQRALEQSRADIAIANLRAIYAAERYYWLENQSYVGGTLDQLSASPRYLLSPDFGAASPYTYEVTPTGGSTFTATATRTGSPAWTGGFAIDQNGAVTGSLTAADGSAAINPPTQ